jgi:hypothetical protein
MQGRVGHMDIYILDKVSYMLNSMLNNINSYIIFCAEETNDKFL